MLHSKLSEFFTKLLQRCYKFSQNEVNDGMKLFYKHISHMLSWRKQPPFKEKGGCKVGVSCL